MLFYTLILIICVINSEKHLELYDDNGKGIDDKMLNQNTVNMQIGGKFYQKQLHFLVIVVIIINHIIMD